MAALPSHQNQVVGKLRQVVHFLVFLVILTGTGSVASAASESLVSLKKRSVKKAEDVLNVPALLESVQLCEQIMEKKGDDLDTLTLLSRLCWSIGNQQPDKKTQKEWFKRGEDVADRIRQTWPDKTDGYYWYAINYGEWVDRSSIFAKIGAKKIILENMNKVLSINDKYDSGGAYIVIGRINYIAPGGSYARALECYEKAIFLAPKRTTAYLYRGELYLHEHMFEKAESDFRKVLSMSVDRRYAIESRDDRKAAERLLRKSDRKDDRFPEQENLTGH